MKKTLCFISILFSFTCGNILNDAFNAEFSRNVTYAVTYNANEADSGEAPVDANRYELNQAVTVLGNTGSLARSGFNFGGWNTASDGSGTDYIQDQTFAMGPADMTLYAKWTVTYTVTYDTNEADTGEVPVDGNRYEQGQNFTVLDNTGDLVKYGYNFGGWNDNTAGSGTDYIQGQTYSIGAADLILYAKWANKSWGTAAYIEDGTANAMNPQVVVDLSGNAIVVWQQSGYIYANRYTQGTGWGGAAVIESETTTAKSPQIAFDASGNAIAVWVQNNHIWANRYTTGTGLWGTAAAIETESGVADLPQIAVNSSGNAIAVWVQAKDSYNNIYANQYTAGTGLWNATAVLIDIDNEDSLTGYFNAFIPQITIDSSGNGIAIWYQSAAPDTNPRDHILANRYTASTGLWGTAARIETDDSNNAKDPQIALDSSGNAIAVWTQSNGTVNNICINQFTAAGTSWSTYELLETDNAGFAGNAHIAFDSSDNAIAVWTQNDGTANYNVYAKRYTGVWGEIALLETITGVALKPRIDFDSHENAIVVWSHYDVSHYHIYANRYLSGTGWGTAGLIETESLVDANDPRIAVDPSGNAIAVWWQTGSPYEVRANIFQ